MVRSRSTRAGAGLLVLLACGCKEAPRSAGACSELGVPVGCEEALVRCAQGHGAPVADVCALACQASPGRPFVCRGDGSPLTLGVGAEADTPRQVAAVDVRIDALACAACRRWEAAPRCVPGRPWCDPERPTVVRRCAPDGATAEPPRDEDDCAATAGVCRAPGCGEEGPTVEAPCAQGATCGDRVCYPGSIACGPGGAEEVRVCSRHGESWRTLADCAGTGTTVRCGPQPVCVGADLPRCDLANPCPAGERCTTPGPQGGPQVCVPVAALGQPCLGEPPTLCEPGAHCVVEYQDAGPAGGPEADAGIREGVCRRACDLSLNDCPAGRACVPISAGAVCSETLDAPHRAPCDTGLSPPCDRGVVLAGRSTCVPVVPPAAAETCNERDDDCDGQTDEGWDLSADPSHCGRCGNTCGRDAECVDGRCRCPEGRVDLDGEAVTGCECVVSAGGVEVCDGRDNDCDGSVDEDFDADGDGFPAAGSAGCAEGTEFDCDDGDRSVNPGAVEACDGRDDDCDGATDERFDLTADVDHCGACGRSCRVANARSACVDGRCPWECPLDDGGRADPRCAVECLEGTVDANGDMRDGCEQSPCSAAPGPAPEVVGVYGLDGALPAALAWRERGAGLLATAGTEADAPALVEAAWPGDAIALGGRRSVAGLPGGPFAVAGVAWEARDARWAILDGDGGRVLWIRPAALDAAGVEALPAARDGARWRGLTYDGAALWAALGGRVFRLTSLPSPTEVLRIPGGGEVFGLAWRPAPAGGRGLLLTSEAARICAYRNDGVCEACWAAPADRRAPGDLAWDGHELWLLDPASATVLQTRPAGLDAGLDAP